jgi:hypothetical protein
LRIGEVGRWKAKFGMRTPPLEKRSFGAAGKWEITRMEGH